MRTWLHYLDTLDDTIANLLHACNPLEHLRGARIAYILSFLVMAFTAILMFDGVLYLYLNLDPQYPEENQALFLLAIQPLWWQVGAFLISVHVFKRAQLFLNYLSWGGLIDQHNAKSK